MKKVEIVRLHEASAMNALTTAKALEKLLNDGFQIVDVTAAHGNTYYVAPIYYILVKDEPDTEPRYQQLAQEKWK